MRRYPCMLLVCLSFLVFAVSAIAGQNENFINVRIAPDHQISTTTNPQILQASAGLMDSMSYYQARAVPRTPVFRPGQAKPITKCRPENPVCVPQPVCKPKCCILPIRLPGQFDLATQVFWAALSGTVKWPAYAAGFGTTELDPADDLGLPRNSVLLEYSGRYQFRPRWALYYSIMPINIEGTTTLRRTMYYGGWLYPAGTQINTHWDSVYQRVGLMYQPILTTDLQVSVYGSWLYHDNQLKLKSYICGGTQSTINRTRNMVMLGVEVQKCVRTLPNGSTLGTDNRVGLGFLDNTFALDAQAALRFSVPMGANRFGYARGGYRYMQTNEDRNDLRLDGTLNGGFAELGIIF